MWYIHKSLVNMTVHAFLKVVKLVDKSRTSRVMIKDVRLIDFSQCQRRNDQAQLEFMYTIFTLSFHVIADILSVIIILSQHLAACISHTA
jgi:hypothetical protein